jgi:hypothetical protein
MVEVVTHPVAYYDKVATSGKGAQGEMERLWSICSANQRAIGQDARVLYEQTELFTSRLADREPPLGTKAWYDNDFYVVDRTFAQGGAYITAWKSLNDPTRLLIVCRGTAFRRTATQGYMSACIDLGKEIGFYGIKSTWSTLQSYLQAGKFQSVDIMGKSLGGGHAQYLAALILAKSALRIERLVTYCSVGVPASVQKLYQKAVANKPWTPAITIFRNGGEGHEMDFVHFFGGSHIYSQGMTRLFYAVPKGQKLDSFDGCFAKIRGLILSLGRAHTRQTTLRSYDLIEKSDIQKEIADGESLEPLRQRVAQVFDFATFSYFNPQTFASFSVE